MRTVRGTLRRAGVIALGALAVACGDRVLLMPASSGSVRSVAVSPAVSTIPGGVTIFLSAVVTADVGIATTVLWTSSNPDVATVDASGRVTGSLTTQGTVTITATSTADGTKWGAASVLVGSVFTPGFGQPPISIASVTDSALNAIMPGGSVDGLINITVNTSGAGTIDIFFSPGSSCSSGAIAMADIKAATTLPQDARGGSTTLGVNTAARSADSGGPVFPNGPYCIKARLSNGNVDWLAVPGAIVVNNP